MPRPLLAVLVVAAALLTACGGGGGSNDEASSSAAASSAPADLTGEPPAPDATAVTTIEQSTVTVDPEPFSEPEEDVARPPFPAPDAAGVVALAMQRPTGSVAYDVTFPQGTYRLTLANDGERGIIHQSQDTGDVWIGAQVGGDAIDFFCTAAAGGTPDCRKGDPDGTAVDTARQIAQIVGSNFIQNTFGPLAALPDVGVGSDTEVDRPVSCLATTLDGRDLRLCATEEGHITEITAGDTRALATEIDDEVPEGALEAPSEPK